MMGPNFLVITIWLAMILTYAIVPYLMPKTLVFGVRIPHERRGDPYLKSVRRDYEIGIFLVGIIAGIVSYYRNHFMNEVMVLTSSGLLLLFLIGNYEIAHARISMRKQHEDWYQGHLQARMAFIDTNDTNMLRKTFIRWLIINAVFIGILSLIAGIIYPHLPKMLPVHWSTQGNVTARVTKNWLTVFQPILVGAVIVLGISLFEAYLLTHLRPDIDPREPHDSFIQYYVFVRRMIHALGIVEMALILSLMLTIFGMWGWLKHPSPMVLASPVLIAVFAVMAISLFTGQEGSRLTTHSSFITTPYDHRDDDAQWKAGLWYYNPDDPKWLVAKRFGVGWTLNFAHPISWLIIGGLIFLVMLSIFIGH
ncbi:DUF1648 domain-containing protein [Sulfobacillus thermosulfidooxidans]|uniref:DUF1648 domain-containing protein n=1 Tax=Sulfobacillus thermosulfidooxidans TaxID=28034 RepID=UPI0006B4FAD2|nr:DUF5808 domain-containing protein [Sulfobacillus thermosulfidooxidans]